METLGACLVANDLPFTGQAKDIFERRVNGESWAKIAKDYNLGSPASARKLFKNLTGIGDFKVKGSDLIKLAKGDLGDLTKVPKFTKPKAPSKPDVPVTKANVPKEKLAKDFQGEYPNHPAGIGQHTTQTVTKLFDQGKTYQQIANQMGLSFEDIDTLVYRNNLAKAHNNAYKAWQQKTNSKHAVEQVKKTVHDARAAGWTTDEISDILGVPKGIQDNIYKGTWKPETLPHQFPKPPAPKTYSKPSEPPSTYKSPGSGHSTISSPGEKIETNGRSIDFDEDNFPVASPQSVARHNGVIDEQAQRSVTSYTGHNYTNINGHLRGKSGPVPDSLISGMDRAMKPLKKAQTFTRGMDRYGFQLGHIDDKTILNLVDKVVTDPGYFSTTAGPSAAFHGEVMFRIEAPKGAKGVWAKPMSNHKGENEFLLARNTNIMITGVSKKTSKYGAVSFIVKGRIVV